MYQSHYQDVMDDGMTEAKRRERDLFDRSIQLLSAARSEGPRSAVKVEAVYFTNRLWVALLEDLVSSENALPDAVRASLISVGMFILKELERIRRDESTDFDSIIEISASIRDGL